MTGRRDFDRRHPLHDALCAYHADQDVARALATALFPETTTPEPHGPGFNREGWRRTLDLGWDADNFKFAGTKRVGVENVWGSLEQPVYADRGRYKQLIGHLDVYLSAWMQVEYVGDVRWTQSQWTAGKTVTSDHTRSFTRLQHSDRHIAIEVKARVTSLGDLIRQLQQYKHEWADYTGPEGEDIGTPDLWVVSSPGMTEGLRTILKEQGFIGIRPGAKFLEWCQTHGLALPPDARQMFAAGAQLSLPEAGDP